MISSSRERIVERFDALHDAVCGVLELSYDVLTTPERLRFLEQLEEETRRLPVPCHELINQIRCEVHHVTDYATCRTTDANDLTLGCGSHHRLITPGG